MSLKVENWREVSRHLGYQVVGDIRDSIVYLLGRRRHWVTGRLAMSYYPELEREDPDGSEVSLRSSVIYSMVLEKGSRPHTPPFDAIERWAVYKYAHILGYASAQELAWRVWGAIRARGNRPHPYIEDSINRVLPR